MHFIRTKGFTLWVAIATLMLSPWQLFSPSPVWAESCTFGADCEQKLWRGILKTYEADLAAARKAKDQAKEVEVLRNAGDAHLYFGEVQKAIPIYQQGLTLARKIQVRNEEKHFIDKLARCHNKLAEGGNTDFLEQEFQRVRQKGDRESQKIVLEELGTTYLITDNYLKTLQTYSIYLPMARQDKDHDGETSALWHLASAYKEMGNYAAAIKALEQAIALKNNPHSRNMYLTRLGEVYLDQRNPTKAIETFFQAGQNAAEIGSAFLITEALEAMAAGYALQGDAEATLKMLAEAMKMTTMVNDGLQPLAQKQVLDKLSLTYAWKGNYAKAIELQKQMGQIRNNPNDILYEHLGAFYLRAGQLKEAEAALKRAIDDYARSRAGLTPGSSNLYDSNYNQTLRINYEMVGPAYQHLQEVLVAQNRTDEALEVSEAARARAFIDLLATRLSMDSRATPIITPPNLAQIKQIAKAQNATLVEYSVINPDLVGYATTMEFRWGKEKPKETDLYIWVIKPTGEVNFRTVDLKSQLSKHRLKALITR